MIRKTIQRALVLEAVRQLQCHATADQIYEAVAAHHPDISKATVYRNLKHLSDEGLIRKRSLPGQPERFDHDCTNHYHIQCSQCGRVFDVDMEYIADLAKHIRNAHGFTVLTHDVIFSGVCPDCQASQDAQ